MKSPHNKIDLYLTNTIHWNVTQSVYVTEDNIHPQHSYSIISGFYLKGRTCKYFTQSIPNDISVITFLLLVILVVNMMHGKMSAKSQN